MRSKNSPRWGVVARSRNHRWVAVAHCACERDARACLQYHRQYGDRCALALLEWTGRRWRALPASIAEAA